MWGDCILYVILTGTQQCQWQQRRLRNMNNDSAVRGVRLSRRPVVPSPVTGRSAAAAVIYGFAPAEGAKTEAVVPATSRPRTGQRDRDGGDTLFGFSPLRSVKSVGSADTGLRLAAEAVAKDKIYSIILKIFFFYSGGGWRGNKLSSSSAEKYYHDTQYTWCVHAAAITDWLTDWLTDRQTDRPTERASDIAF